MTELCGEGQREKGKGEVKSELGKSIRITQSLV